MPWGQPLPEKEVCAMVIWDGSGPVEGLVLRGVALTAIGKRSVNGNFILLNWRDLVREAVRIKINSSLEVVGQLKIDLRNLS